MKWLVRLLVLFVLATAVKEGWDYFGPMAQAFRAYREAAEPGVRAGRNDPRFRNVEGHIIHVSHELESAERTDDGGVRLVVLQSVHFQRVSESGPFGNRRIATTRQRVRMTRAGAEWSVAKIEEDATEIVEPSTIDVGN